MKALRIIAACLAVGSIALLAGCSPSAEQFRMVFYNGHTYVVYDGDDFDSGMVHDPDCKCGHGE